MCVPLLVLPTFVRLRHSPKHEPLLNYLSGRHAPVLPPMSDDGKQAACGVGRSAVRSMPPEVVRKKGEAGEQKQNRGDGGTETSE